MKAAFRHSTGVCPALSCRAATPRSRAALLRRAQVGGELFGGRGHPQSLAPQPLSRVMRSSCARCRHGPQAPRARPFPRPAISCPPCERVRPLRRFRLRAASGWITDRGGQSVRVRRLPTAPRTMAVRLVPEVRRARMRGVPVAGDRGDAGGVAGRRTNGP